VVFVERESHYRGVYHLAQFGAARIEIQPNAIDGSSGFNGSVVTRGVGG
jgi:hypothetical protein